MLIVGRYLGSIGLTSVSVGGDISGFLTFIAIGFSNAGQVIIAQFIGANREDQIGKFIGTMMKSLLLCALAVSIASFFLRKYFLLWMNTPDEAWEYALAYTTICNMGLVFIYGYNAVSAIMRGFGDSRHPFIFVSIAAILNVFLDFLFVKYFHWGAGGAALATVSSQAVSFGYAMFYICGNRNIYQIKFDRENLRIDYEMLGILVKLGIPMAIRNAAVSFSKLCVNSWINSYGVVVAAVSGIANKFNTIANLFSNAVNTAGASMIGQNIGAAKYQRVPRVMLSAFVIDSSIMGILIWLLATFPETIYSFFTTDTSVIFVGLEYVPIGAFVFLGNAFRAAMNAFLNGSGNYRINFAVAILDGMILRVSLSLLFGTIFKWGYKGFWLGDAAASFTPFVIGALYYKYGDWKKR